MVQSGCRFAPAPLREQVSRRTGRSQKLQTLLPGIKRFLPATAAGTAARHNRAALFAGIGAGVGRRGLGVGDAESGEAGEMVEEFSHGNSFRFLEFAPAAEVATRAVSAKAKCRRSW